MKKLISLSFALAFVLIAKTSFSQEPKIPKFGKDLTEHLELTTCNFDSSANAVILFDYGTSLIKYNKDKGYFYVEINRQTRIKILSKDGLDWADGSIPIYRSKSTKEKLAKFSAVTYNMENGKIEKVKLDRKTMSEEEVNESFSRIKFTMPKAKVGSVLEIEYTILSDFTYNLQYWVFQKSIPTLISKYIVEIPEFYKYNHRLSGYENITVKKDSGKETIFFRDSYFSSSTTRATDMTTVTYDSEIFTFYGYNIPKLRNEPFVDDIRNYQSRVDFELQHTKFPNQSVKQYASNWEKVTNDLLDDSNFGKELINVGFLKDDIQAVVNDRTNPNEKMLAVFEFMKGKIKWNDRYRLKTEKGIRKAYNDGFGNSSEVNLCLIAALKEAGLDAFPIALSTRSTGLLHTWEVSYSKLNHVIAGVNIDGKIITLDATSSFSAPNILPLECLNGNARIIDKRKANWIDLNPTIISKSSLYIDSKLTETDQVENTVNYTLNDYSALRLYNTLVGDEDFTKYKELLEKNFKNGEVDSIKVSQNILPNPEIKVSYFAKIPESVNHAGDMIYLSVGVGFLRSSNPFTTPERKLPINFHFPFEESIVIKYSIPEGYEVVEKPENLIKRLSDKKGSFLYSVSQIGNEIIVTSRMSIHQTLFIPNDYKELKDFYESMVNKNAEKIVLKKI